MTESETDDEILARIETALQKIAAVGKPAPASAPASFSLNRDRVTTALDTIIGRLREVLEPPASEPAPGHLTE